LLELHLFRDVVMQASDGVSRVNDELGEGVHKLGSKLFLFLQSNFDGFVH